MTRWMRGVALVALLEAAVLLLVPAAAGAEGQPSITLSTTNLVPGQTVAVMGRGWPLGTDIQVQLCGQMAIDGSADCALDASATMSPGPDGTLLDHLIVKAPPRPCPCAALVQTISGAFSTAIPVTIAGVAVVPVPIQAPVAVLSAAARTSGGLSLASLFGLGAHRTLVVTLHNAGPGTESYPVVSARWGRPGHPRLVINTPAVAALAPGQTQQVRATFSLDPLSHGTYEVTVSVEGTGLPVTVTSDTSTEPWALLIGGLLLLQGALLWVRNRVRARLGSRRSADAAADEPDIDLRETLVLRDEAPDAWIVGDGSVLASERTNA